MNEVIRPPPKTR